MYAFFFRPENRTVISLWLQWLTTKLKPTVKFPKAIYKNTRTVIALHDTNF